MEIPRELLANQNNIDYCIDTMFVNALNQNRSRRVSAIFHTVKVVEYKMALTKYASIFKCCIPFASYSVIRNFKHYFSISRKILSSKDFNLAKSSQHVPQAELTQFLHPSGGLSSCYNVLLMRNKILDHNSLMSE